MSAPLLGGSVSAGRNALNAPAHAETCIIIISAEVVEAEAEVGAEAETEMIITSSLSRS